MENKELLLNAFNYYDKNYEKNKDIFKNVKYYIHEHSDNDLEHSIMIFYDKDKKELFKSRYEVLSFYITKAQIWVWGWASPTIRKNKIGLIKKVLNYGLSLEYGESIVQSYTMLLKTILTTSRLRVDNPIQLDINIALASYISKSHNVLGISLDEKIEEVEEYKKIKYIPFETEIKDTSVICTYYSFLDL